MSAGRNAPGANTAWLLMSEEAQRPMRIPRYNPLTPNERKAQRARSEYSMAVNEQGSAATNANPLPQIP